MKINERFPPELLQVLTHFYRGEVQRATDWRRRLDTTTNWAIIAMTAAFSWTFGQSNPHPDNHIIFLFTSGVVFLLLWIEARRYRHFDVWRTRVRMLEVHLVMPSLNPEHDILQGDWREVLSNDLLLPSFKISFLEAAAKRLRANYTWIFLGLLLGWMLRVYISASQNAQSGVSFGDVWNACGYADVLSPTFVVVTYGGFLGAILGLLIATWRRRNVTGEIRRRDRKARQWPI